MAYGLNEETGRDSMSFGPLNRAGGERRLNVAVTRSREAITLVSSIRSDYIDLNRTKARGARRLRAYLDYAERGPSALGSESVQTGRDFESPFEEAVARALIRIIHQPLGASPRFPQEPDASAFRLIDTLSCSRFS